MHSGGSLEISVVGVLRVGYCGLFPPPSSSTHSEIYFTHLYDLCSIFLWEVSPGDYSVKLRDLNCVAYSTRTVIMIRGMVCGHSPNDFLDT